MPALLPLISGSFPVYNVVCANYVRGVQDYGRSEDGGLNGNNGKTREADK